MNGFASGIASAARRFRASPLGPVLGVFAATAALAFADLASSRVGVAAFGWLSVGGLVVSAAAWGALLSAPALLVGRRARWLYAALALLWIPMTALQWHSRWRYHMPLDGSWVGIALCGSVSEVQWYLKNHLSALTVLVIVAVFAAAVAAFRWFRDRDYPRPSFACAVAAVAAVALFAARNCGDWSAPARTFRRLAAVNFIADTDEQLGDYRRLLAMCAHPRLPERVELAVPAEAAPVGVFVIGESATRNRWGLYGYARQTTPCLSAMKDRLCVFADATATASYTAAVMCDLLTHPGARGGSSAAYNLPQLLNAAGYDCELVTSDARWGKGDGLETFLFHGCREMHFLAEKGLPEPWYDDAQLPYLEKALADGDGRPLLVFLHLRGSHTPMDAQYPPGTGPFPGETIRRGVDRGDPQLCRNHYDNSIAFTDRLLGRVVELLEATGRPAWMLYLSDHGESVESRSWRDVTDRNLWEVPMVWWRSDAYAELAPEVARQMAASVRKPFRSDGIFDMIVRCALVNVGE